MDIDVQLLDFSAEDSDRALQQWLLIESQTPFDLYRGPLIRVTLIELETNRYAFNLCTHHAISDGWSLVVILEEIFQIYSGCSKPPEIQQFADYVQWYEKEAKSDSFKTSELFWLETLDRVSRSPLDLPFDYMASEQRTYKGARVSTQVASDLVSKLKERSKAWNSTLFHMLFGIYAHQMKLFCQQDKITIGISVNGRPARLAEHLVGYCSHFIPIYLDLGESSTWKKRVQGTKNSLIQALKHQNVPFARILKQLPQSQRDNVIQVTFNLDLDMGLPELRDLQTQIISQPVTSARYSIGLNVIPEVDILNFDLDYNTDLFQASTMKKFLADFIEVLHRI